VVDRYGIVEVRSMSPQDFQGPDGLPDTTRMARATLDLMARYSIRADHVAIDAGGGGQEAIGDPLRRMGYRVRMINFGGSPSKRRRKAYRNLRAELYGVMAEVVNPANWTRGGAPVTGDGADAEDAAGESDGSRAGAAPDAPTRWTRCFALDLDGPCGDELRLLVDELSLIPKHRDGEGRMYLPSKDKDRAGSDQVCLRDIIGHSPDRSDALALACWAMRTAERPVARVEGDVAWTIDEAGVAPSAAPGVNSLADRLFGPVPADFNL